MPANDRQVGGTHYRDQAMEHWDLVIQADIPYMEAQIIKYLSRWRQKGGMADINKAEHFLEKLIEVNSDKLRCCNLFMLFGSCWRAVLGRIERRERLVNHYIEVNRIPVDEARIIRFVANWQDWDGRATLRDAMKSFAPLRERVRVEERWVDSGEPQGRGYINQDQ